MTRPAVFAICAARTEADAAAAQPLGRAISVEWRETYTGWTDLHYAAALNLPGAVAALVEAEVDSAVRLTERAWLPAGVSLWPEELAELGLGGAFAGWEADSETPAMIAARTNSAAALAELVARGAEFDADTLIIHAAEENAPDAAEWLIAHGADIHAGGNDGETPLHRAARRGARGAVEFLVSRGADIDVGTTSGKTLLHEAAREDWSVAEFLAGRGADVDAEDRSGRTPLHYAAWGALRRLGADPRRPRCRGRRQGPGRRRAAALRGAIQVARYGETPHRPRCRYRRQEQRQRDAVVRRGAARSTRRRFLSTVVPTSTRRTHGGERRRTPSSGGTVRTSRNGSPNAAGRLRIPVPKESCGARHRARPRACRRRGRRTTCPTGRRCRWSRRRARSAAGSPRRAPVRSSANSSAPPSTARPRGCPSCPRRIRGGRI